MFSGTKTARPSRRREQHDEFFPGGEQETDGGTFADASAARPPATRPDAASMSPATHSSSHLTNASPGRRGACAQHAQLWVCSRVPPLAGVGCRGCGRLPGNEGAAFQEPAAPSAMSGIDCVGLHARCRAGHVIGGAIQRYFTSCFVHAIAWRARGRGGEPSPSFLQSCHGTT